MVLQYENNLESQSVHRYCQDISFKVCTHIFPALEILRIEHHLTELDFVHLVTGASIIPPHNKRLMAKALWFGYDGDFVAALHLLAPQIESLVRFHLKNLESNTVHIKENREDEIGLSSLMEREEIKQVFDENLIFEIKTIFSDARGFNLRNNVAHGLINDDSSEIPAIYAWWFVLKLVLESFFIGYEQE